MPLIKGGSPPIRVRLDTEDLPFPVCRDSQGPGRNGLLRPRASVLDGGHRLHLLGHAGARGLLGRGAGGSDAAVSPPCAAHRACLGLPCDAGAPGGVPGHQRRPASGPGRLPARQRRLIDAAIWFCDLRDFTSLSEQGTAQATVKTLDEYFDHVAGAVMERGGEVLKFIGDAILAIFPVAGDAHRACQSALMAAEEALASLQRLNAERHARGTGRWPSVLPCTWAR